ncbi:hypothetical protein SESBI_43939 [Sesbania bispinosa]|nr:hypothetical protein SESBI_43939 [Sesbania bispinosa]
MDLLLEQQDADNSSEQRSSVSGRNISISGLTMAGVLLRVLSSSVVRLTDTGGASIPVPSHGGGGILSNSIA